MVLDTDSMSPAADQFAAETTPSDDDPYSRPSIAPGIRINETEIQHPLPVLGPLFGYTEAKLVTLINKRIEYTSKMLKRSINQDEATAMAYWTSVSYNRSSYGAPLGIAVASYQAYKTQADYKFPFVNRGAQTTFNPDKLLGLRGRSAQLAWHGLRWTAYWMVGSWFGRTLAFSLGRSSTLAGERSDKRLNNVNKEIEERIRSDLSRRERPMVPTQEQSSRAVGRSGGLEEADTQAQRNDGFYSDSSIPGDGSMQQTTTASSRFEDRAAPMPSSRAPPPSSDFDDSFDDASPTAGGDSASGNSEPESAWSRVRRGATSPNSDTRRGSSGPIDRSRPEASSSGGQGSWARNRAATQQPNGGDQFSFSNEEEDRHLAKEEAQRDFDARLERERRGADFGGDDRK